jgi:hypothetical protein
MKKREQERTRRRGRRDRDHVILLGKSTRAGSRIKVINEALTLSTIATYMIHFLRQ